MNTSATSFSVQDSFSDAISKLYKYENNSLKEIKTINSDIRLLYNAKDELTNEFCVRKSFNTDKGQWYICYDIYDSDTFFFKKSVKENYCVCYKGISKFNKEKLDNNALLCQLSDVSLYDIKNDKKLLLMVY